MCRTIPNYLCTVSRKEEFFLSDNKMLQIMNLGFRGILSHNYPSYRIVNAHVELVSF
jgi:hypothetical protein